ncbi:MAG TPA: GTPase domain-containing protein [Pirellulales bacterium]|nr:GTPase domain-containing protein [Pirellulales bacterium]
MTTDLAHLQLLAEVDSLVAELRAWSDRAPDWPAARQAQALVRRLQQRTDTLRIRLEAPLVVGTLGGTGTGKSTLVNALVGADVTETGRQRPTTRRPVLVTRPDITPELLGIDPALVEHVTRDTPALADLVLVDCPDPDTAEDGSDPASNVARLRALLPHCDVLLVTTTQQKYRSARVSTELAAAASGARLVFVQTHADHDDDIRDDWRHSLGDDYAAGEMFFVDSLEAMREIESSVQPRGEFGRLVQLVTRQLSGTAAHRIRRANFLDLLDETLEACSQQVDASLPAVDQLETAISEQRSRLATRLAAQLRDDLLGRRRSWEQRLLGEITARWGFSPFSCLLRLYQGIGGLFSGAILMRARTPAQIALWGTMEGARRLRARSSEKSGELTTRAAEFRWEEGDLRTSAIILDGYAAEAGLPREELAPSALDRQAQVVAADFLTRASVDVQQLVTRLAARHTGFVTRMVYELLLVAMLGVLLYRFGRNFFYDSWLAVELGLKSTPAPLFGTDFFIAAAVALALWCALLLWLFTARLRRGLRGEVLATSQTWNSPTTTAALVAGLEGRVHAIHAWRHDLQHLDERVIDLKGRIEAPEPRLGHRVA